MMEILGLVLGILALVLAMWHLREIKSQSRETRALASDTHTLTGETRAQAEQTRSQALELQNLLEDIRRSLSTRYIGEFPEYLPEIVNAIKRARKDVLICCDFPGYGNFTDHSNWLEYKHAIETKSEGGIRFNVTFFSEKRRLDSHHDQFSEAEESWDEWKKEPKTRVKLVHFLKSHGKAKEIDALSVEEFATLLEKTDRGMLKETFGTADVQQIDGYMPLFFWLVDRNEAIFSIPSFSNKQSEYGFFTSDPRLISALLEMTSSLAQGSSGRLPRETGLPGLDSQQST